MVVVLCMVSCSEDLVVAALVLGRAHVGEQGLNIVSIITTVVII